MMLIPGLSGYEGRVRRYIARQLADLGLKTSTDRLGNLIATLDGVAGAPRSCCSRIWTSSASSSA